MSEADVTAYLAKLHEATGPVQTGSYGIGMGGITFKAVLFWLLVGVPLTWGIWITVEKALVLFTG